MNRRSFVAALSAASALAAAPEKRTRFYVFDSYKLKAGTELPRLHEHFSKTLLPKANSLWNGPKIFLEAMVAPHLPQVMAIYGFGSLDEMWSIRGKIAVDLDPGPDPNFESLDTMLVEAAPYSPEITAATPAKPRLFELRTYHSPTYHQLGALHDRFSGPEIKIFHRSGIHPVLYSSTLIGPSMPNLTYLIPFDDLAHRETAWNTFAAAPDWIKARKESIDKSGQIASIQNISLWKAAEYSPVR